MKKIMTMSLVLALTLIFAVGSALAADRSRTKKRDKSCRSAITTESTTLELAKQRDRKRDRSCQNILSTQDDAITLAADRKRDKRRDGTCRS